MKCQDCKLWEFPTRALFQELYTKGYCASELPVKMTYPDDTCKKFLAEEKPEELKQAVRNAMPLIKRERFGASMNIDLDIAVAETKVTELKRKKMKEEIEAIADQSLPDSVKLMPNDMVRVEYREPLKIAQAFSSKQGGEPFYYACMKPDKTLVLINTRECKVTKC